jgi:hypothetical protein
MTQVWDDDNRVVPVTVLRVRLPSGPDQDHRERRLQRPAGHLRDPQGLEADPARGRPVRKAGVDPGHPPRRAPARRRVRATRSARRSAPTSSLGRAGRRHLGQQGQGLRRRHEAPRLLRPAASHGAHQVHRAPGRHRRLRHPVAGVPGHRDGRPHRVARRPPPSTSRSCRPTPSATCCWSRAPCPDPTAASCSIRDAVKAGEGTLMPTDQRHHAAGKAAASSSSTTPVRRRAQRAVMHQVVTAQLAARRPAPSPPRPGPRCRRRRQAVAPEGHRPGPPGLHPLAAVAGRWRGPRAQAPQLQQRTPKKMIRLALGSALSDALHDDRSRCSTLGLRRPEHQAASRLLGPRASRAGCSSCSPDGRRPLEEPAQPAARARLYPAS